MSNRKNYYFGQKVTPEDLNPGFDYAEASDWSIVSDLTFTGIATNATVTQHSPVPDLTVDVSGNAAIYDPLGKRIYIAATQTINVAVDSNGVSTAVASASNEKWVSIFIRYRKLQSDPKIDDNAQKLFFSLTEGYEFIVTQGAEATIGTATRPALMADAILLGDVRRLNGQTQILNANISAQSGTGYFSTTRRQDTFIASSGALSLRAGTAKAAMQSLIALVAGGNTATNVTYGGSGFWADGSTSLPSASVESTLDSIVSSLAGTNGWNLLGGSTTAAWRNSGGGDFSGITTIKGVQEKVIVDLASLTSGASGARRIGFDTQGLATWRTNGTLTGPFAGTTASVWHGLNSIVSDLALAAVATNSGASRVGFFPQANITASNVEAALAELGNTKPKLVDVQTFAASGTWTKPTGTPAPQFVEIYLIGGGGGGGSGRRGAAGTVRCGGGGGGGGARVHAQFPASALSATMTVTVGSGGAGGAARTSDDTTGATGVTGGSSSVTNSGSTIALALGGVGGRFGGTTLLSSNAGSSGMFTSGYGGNAGDGTTGSVIGETATAAGSGGGGGGGIGTGNTFQVGADGGQLNASYASLTGAGVGGTSAGASGTAGTSVIAQHAGGGAGGGGGASGISVAGGTGGAGGSYGGGGGGGGASTNGFNSGAGGAGGNGFVLIVTRF